MLLLDTAVRQQQQELALLQGQADPLYLALHTERENLRQDTNDLVASYNSISKEVYTLRRTILMLEKLAPKMQAFVELGNELEKDPIYTSSGKYELINSNPSAIWGEMANTITQTSRWTAHVIVDKGGTLQSYTIKTESLPAFTTLEYKERAIARGQELKRLSQEFYSKDRDDDEGDQTVPMDEPEPPAPSSPPASGAPKVQIDDDDKDDIIVTHERY